MFCRILTYLENLPLYCLIYLLLKILWPSVLPKNVFVYDFASIFNIDHILLFYMRSVREQLTLSPQPSQTASSFRIPHINSLNHLEWLICFFFFPSFLFFVVSIGLFHWLFQCNTLTNNDPSTDVSGLWSSSTKFLVSAQSPHPTEQWSIDTLPRASSLTVPSLTAAKTIINYH